MQVPSLNSISTARVGGSTSSSSVVVLVVTVRFVAGIIFSLNDKSSSSNLKIDALACLYVVMVTHPAHAFHAHVPALVPPVVSCVGDPFYKITSEALLVTQQLVKVETEHAAAAAATWLRPHDPTLFLCPAGHQTSGQPTGWLGDL